MGKVKTEIESVKNKECERLLEKVMSFVEIDKCWNLIGSNSYKLHVITIAIKCRVQRFDKTKSHHRRKCLLTLHRLVIKGRKEEQVCSKNIKIGTNRDPLLCLRACNNRDILTHIQRGLARRGKLIREPWETKQLPILPLYSFLSI